MKVLSIGEILWDVFPNEELLGGAALNFATNCRRLEHSPVLLSGVGDDRRGKVALQAVEASGVDTTFIQEQKALPTGTALVGTNLYGELEFEIVRPAAYDLLALTDNAIRELRNHDFDWLYFGTLMQTEQNVERVTIQLANLSHRIRCFYDVNLRPHQWSFALVQRLLRLATVVKLNESEARIIAQLSGTSQEAFGLRRFCVELALLYDLEAICVTLGEDGCYVYIDGSGLQVPGFPTVVCDTVSAGDAFSAAFLHGLHKKWASVRIAQFANAVGSLVASRSGATPHWSTEEALVKAGL